MNKAVILLKFIFVISTGLHAQQVLSSFEAPVHTTKYGYTQKVDIYYQTEEIGNILPIDMVTLSPKSITKDYVKYYDEQNGLTTRIDIIASENMFPEWMPQPKTTIITPTETRTYGTNDELMSETPRSNLSLEKTEHLNGSIFPTLPPSTLTNQIIDSLNSHGVSSEISPQGAVRLSSDKFNMQYNPNTKIVRTTKLKDGSPDYSIQVEYETLSSGHTVMKTITETQELHLSNGACARRITKKVFSDHVIREKANEHANHPNNILESTDNTFQCYPVPASNIITVNTEKTFAETTNFKIVIFDSTGKIIRAIKDVNHFPISFPIANLDEGIYWLQIEDGTQRWIKRFVKF